MRKYEGVWHKRMLLPCWILQFLCAGIYAILGGLLIAASKAVQVYSDRNGNRYSKVVDNVAAYVLGLAAAVLTFAMLTILFNIVEIILYMMRKLNPVVVVVFSVIKLLGWGICFVVSIIAVARRNVSVGDLILGLILVATSVTQLVFGAKYTHLKRKGFFDNGSYQRTKGGAEAVRLNPGGAYGGPTPANAGYESYREVSPAASYVNHTAVPGATAGNYHAQGVELLHQPPKPYQ